MTIDLDALERLAKAAGAGSWDLDEHPGNPPFPVLQHGGRYLALSNLFESGEAEHIAGADPATVLALVAELRPARDVVDAAREFLDVLESDPEYPLERAERLAKLIDIATAKREVT